MSQQFFKSATSIGANVEEAIAANNKKEFTAKMGISSKEAREVLYRIRLIRSKGFVEYNFQRLKDESRQLILILTSIVKSSRENQ